MERQKETQIQGINDSLGRLSEALGQLGNTDSAQWGQISEVLQEMNGICNDAGIYSLLPTVPLLIRGKTFYNTNIGAVRDYLIQQTDKRGEHLDADTIGAVIGDYARMFAGSFEFYATPEQMLHVLTCCSPQGAFMFDRYAFYFALLLGYTRRVRTVQRYNNIILTEEKNGRTHETTRAVKLEFLAGPENMNDARGVDWLISRGIFDATLFTSAATPATVSLFLDRVNTLAHLQDYALYYLIAKYCLSATPEELAEIPQPKVICTSERAYKNAADWAEDYAKGVIEHLNKLAAKYADVITAEREQDAQQAREQAAQQSEIVADRVRIPETFGLLLSRDVCGAVNGNTNDILPIKAFIDDYMQRKKLTGIITPRTVEKTIEGLNLLQKEQRVTPVNGRYTFHTNISRFAELCGFYDANDEEKKGILAALGVLDGMYLAVWRPKGISAVNVLNIREIGLTGGAKGDLVLDVTTDAMKGRPQLIAWDDFKALRQRAKGKAENHFRYQIFSKGHKEENALLNEVFGYDHKIAEAEKLGTPEDLAAVRLNIKSHKPRDRKKLQMWFEDYQREGYIKYSKKTNPKGETVYYWRKLKTVPVEQLGPQEPAQDPDDQGAQ